MSNNSFRVESDSMGELQIPFDKYYGVQTQRSINNFPICRENLGHRMPKEVVMAMLLIKKTAAITNKKILQNEQKTGKISTEYKKFSVEIADKIIEAVDLILGISSMEKLDLIRKNNNNLSQEVDIFEWFYQNHFPLVIWQTGSGTQTNMNVNEVIASVANEITTGVKGGKLPVHPNDHVNLGQSSNDTFPTAMNISAVLLSYNKLFPSLIRFWQELGKKVDGFSEIIKIGRTHTQDATPVTLGDEFSAYKYQVFTTLVQLNDIIDGVLFLAQGGTAVGTGLNCHKDFPQLFAENISELTKIKELTQKHWDSFKSLDKTLNSPKFETEFSKNGFQTSYNKFYSLSTSDELVALHGGLNNLACSIMKIANDIRFLASGPRSGIGELSLPENEPGSSIMPGKVNPTQCEALTMIACQVIGNNVAVTTGGMQGHFQLNVFRPMIIRNVIESINLLSDGINSFIDNCLVGIVANEGRIKELLEQSLMLVTALNPYLGYDNSAKIAKNAHKKNLTLKQSAEELGFIGNSDGQITDEKWIEVLNPKLMC